MSWVLLLDWIFFSFFFYLFILFMISANPLIRQTQPRGTRQGMNVCQEGPQDGVMGRTRSLIRPGRRVEASVSFATRQHACLGKWASSADQNELGAEPARGPQRDPRPSQTWDL